MDSASNSVGDDSNRVRIYYPPSHVKDNAYISTMESYTAMYEESLNNPGAFWFKFVDEFYWHKKPSLEKACKCNMDTRAGAISIRWFEDGQTNISYNALDRNVERGLGDRVAYRWVGNDPQDERTITYNDLLVEVCRFTKVLERLGVHAGDRVCLYMPVAIELVVAMLAVVRLGAVHSVVFGGFSAHSLADRLLDSCCDVLITADGAFRGEKLIELKSICDTAIDLAARQGHRVSQCVVVRHLLPLPGDTNVYEKAGKRPYSRVPCNWHDGRDFWYEELMQQVKDSEVGDSDVKPGHLHEASWYREPVWRDAEAPLFVLYTSGSTGRPKGIVHTTAGYMIYTYATFKYVFDYHCDRDDVFWCTADVGWITGHSYVVYGPLTNCATSVLFEGIPFYPDASRYWQVVDQCKVTQFYTAPTALRSLMKLGDDYVKKTQRNSLRVLGTVGEPINLSAWLWYYDVVGQGKCSIVDTYWQTETGGHVIVNLPGATPMKPGSAALPFFGVRPLVIAKSDEDRDFTSTIKLVEKTTAVVAKDEVEGYLVIATPWPGMARSIWGDHDRFERTYFSDFPGYYVTGDSARRDKDGYFWITGRIDDMLNVSGHLIATREVESAINEHPMVAESAVVARAHPVKGECLYGFVTLKDEATAVGEPHTHLNDAVRKQIVALVRDRIGPFAAPDYLQEAPALPKTRSGKIMRRILKAIANGKSDGFGDLTTLADPDVIQLLLKLRIN